MLKSVNFQMITRIDSYDMLLRIEVEEGLISNSTEINII